MTPFITSSPLGPIAFTLHNNKLKSLDLVPPSSANYAKPLPSSAKHISQALQNYFQNPQTRFNIEMDLEGTVFQKKVWLALCQISPGSTLSYGELAKQLKTSPRAIGNACRANPIPLVVPCHRIVAKHHIGGYSGATQGKMLRIKEWLLKHEQVSKTVHPTK